MMMFGWLFRRGAWMVRRDRRLTTCEPAVLRLRHVVSALHVHPIGTRHDEDRNEPSFGLAAQGGVEHQVPVEVPRGDLRWIGRQERCDQPPGWIQHHRPVQRAPTITGCPFVPVHLGITGVELQPNDQLVLPRFRDCVTCNGAPGATPITARLQHLAGGLRRVRHRGDSGEKRGDMNRGGARLIEHARGERSQVRSLAQVEGWSQWQGSGSGSSWGQDHLGSFHT